MRSFFIALVILILCNITIAREIPVEDSEWLKTTDDITDFLNLALNELKMKSTIHAFDDVRFIRVLQQRKTLAGYNRSLYMKLLVSSMHFESNKAEESISVFMMQNKEENHYDIYFPSLPVMKESFILSLQHDENSLSGDVNALKVEVSPEGDTAFVN